MDLEEIKKESKLWKLFDTKNLQCMKLMIEYILDMKKIWVSYEYDKDNSEGIIKYSAFLKNKNSKYAK